MKNKTLKTGTLILLSAAFFILTGCRAETEKPKIEKIFSPMPTDAVENYLKLVYRTDKRDEAYEFLTAQAKTEIPREDFKSLLRGELSRDFSGRTSSEIHVRVNHVKVFSQSDDHYIVYSLLYLSFPYDINPTDRFRLTRFHVRREEGAWHIEPFINKETFTKRLVPSLVVGTEWELEKKRPEFYDIIGKDLLKERRGAEPPVEKTITEAEPKPETEPQPETQPVKELEKVGTLVIPDLQAEKPAEPVEEKEAVKEPVESKPTPAVDLSSSAEADTAQTGVSSEPAGENNGETAPVAKADAAGQIETFLSTGKAQFEEGNLPDAEKSFQKVLELDPTNAIAKDLLAKCADLRTLNDEKRKQIEIYEKLLELEEQGEGKTN